MDTQRVHHTDNSYPFNRAGTNARAIVNCSLKNRRTRVESNKPGVIRDRVKLTASNRVVSACRCRTNTDLNHCRMLKECSRHLSHCVCGSNVLCLAVLYRTVPPPIIYQGPWYAPAYDDDPWVATIR